MRLLVTLRRAGIVALLVLLWIRPEIGTVDRQVRGTGLAVVLVVDRSTSMAALDVDDGPRFDRARADLETLVQSLPATTFTLISFATDTQLELPTTGDRAHALRVLDDLDVESPVDAGGSRLVRPLPRIRAVLDRLRAADPDQRVVLVLTGDGEDTAPEDPDAAPEDLSYAGLASRIDDGAVLGYGTAAGGRMPVDTVEGPDVGFVPDLTTGRPAVSRLDEANLRGAADALDVPFVHRDRTDGIAAVVARLSDGISAKEGSVRTARELSWLVALALLALVALDLRSTWRGLLTTRRERRAAR